MLGISKDDLKAQMEQRYANSRSEIMQRVKDHLKSGELTIEELVRLVIRESYWRAAIDLVELDVSRPRGQRPKRAKIGPGIDVSGHR